MNYTKEIKINKTDLEQITKWLELPTCNDDETNPVDTNDCQGEGNTMSFTAVFENGYEMDIKCCGCTDCASWVEAVLFHYGIELCCTECLEEILGEFSLDYEENTYTVIVVKE